MNIAYYKPSDLIAAEYNPRQLTKEQHKDLTDSIKRFGLVDPLIVNTHKDRKNVLVGGHQRLKIASELDIKEIPCVEIKLTPAKERELNIRLNKNVGEWDYDSLANYFDVSELMEWGFSNDELQFYEEEPEQGLIDDDEIPEVEEAITKSGDIWLLGEHRLLCGDATKKEDVERLMDGQKADMVFTDPPYGMNLNVSNSNTIVPKDKWKNKAKNYSAVIGDDVDYDPTHLFEMFPDVKEMFLWGFDYYAESIPKLKDGSVIVWDKRKGIEDLVFSFSEFELCWSRKKHHREIVRIAWFGLIGTEQEFDHKRHHPTQKPIKLSSWFVEKYADVGWLVVDLFLGSGSTLIACEKTNRKCYGMEIDPHYCDVIVKRWEEYTGNKAERVERAES